MTRSRLDRLAVWFRPRRCAAEVAATAFAQRALRFSAAQSLISAFYAVLLFFAADNLYSWSGYLQITDLTPRWPVFWLRYIDPASGIAGILGFHLAAGLLGVTSAQHRWARVLVFVAWLEFLAFKFSFGSINHGDHLSVLLSFLLIFLPTGWRSYPGASRRVQSATLLAFAGCQMMILLTYSMAGMWKVGGVVEQCLKGEVHYLSPDGLAQQIAAKLLSDDTTSILGPWFITHPWVGWPLVLAALYLEFFALWAVPRPSLHASFGLGLILLHLFTHLTMGVGFAQNNLWLALFLVFSPFRPARPSWRQMLRDLPLLGRLATRFLPSPGKSVHALPE